MPVPMECGVQAHVLTAIAEGSPGKLEFMERFSPERCFGFDYRSFGLAARGTDTAK